VIRCEKCGGDIDPGGHCTRCGQPSVTYTGNVPADPQCGAIEEACRLLDEHCSPGFSYGCVPQARAELAALQADNARMREALAAIKRHQEIAAGPRIIPGMSVTHKIAVDALDGLSTPAPAGAFVTLDFFKLAVEIERAFRGWVEDITVRWDGITVRLRRLGAPAPAEVRLEHQVTKAEVEAMVNPIECIITSLAAAILDTEGEEP